MKRRKQIEENKNKMKMKTGIVGLMRFRHGGMMVSLEV
jgi:hypothetical protein